MNEIVGANRRATNDMIGPDSGDIDVQVETAKRYPRDPEQALSRAISLATIDHDAASDCMYALPRGGKIIEGKSTRLAEIASGAWGNMRIAAKTIAEDDKYVHAEAVAWDLESNVAVSIQTRRRITSSNGRRYNDDMIVITANAAISIAYRNAAFRVLPKDFVGRVYEAARQKIADDDGQEPLENRRAEMLKYFAGLAVTEKQICELLGIKAVNEITSNHIVILRGFAVSIKDGVTDVAAIFKPRGKKSKQPEPQAKDAKPEQDPAPEPPAGSNNDKPEVDLIEKIFAELDNRWPDQTEEAEGERMTELEAVFGVNDRSELKDLSMKILRKGLKELQRRAGEAELDEAGLDAPDTVPAEKSETQEKPAAKPNKIPDKATIINSIFNEIERLCDGLDGAAVEARQNELLAQTFGSADLKQIEQLLPMMLMAGLRTLKDLQSEGGRKR